MSGTTIASTPENVAMINAMLEGTTIAPVALPQAPTMPAWRSRPASQTQVARTMRLEEAILEDGHKPLVKKIARHHGEFANAGAISDYYKPLAKLASKRGLDWRA